MDGLIDVTLDYLHDEGPVTYTRRITNAQLAQLIMQLDEMADSNDEE